METNIFKASFLTDFRAPSELNEIRLINESDFSSAFRTENADNFFKSFNQNGSQSVATLTQWYERLNVTDKTMRSYLQDCMQKQVPASFDGYNDYVQSAIQSNQQLTLSARAGEAGLKLLSAAANMLLFAAIGKAVQLAATAIDNYVHRVEKANEAMAEAVSEYDSAKSSLENTNSELEEQSKRLDELLSKDKLTYAEKSELEKLQEITKELLIQQDIEERRTKNASKKAAQETINAYGKQYGKYVDEEDVNEKYEYTKYVGVYAYGNADDVTGNIASYLRAKELYEEAQQDYEKTSRNGEDTSFLADDMQRYTDMIDDYSSNLDNNIADLQEKQLALEEEYHQALEKSENGTEPLTSYEQDVIDTYTSIHDAIKMIYKYFNQNDWNDMEIKNIFHIEGIEKTKEELRALAAEGKLTPEKIASEFPKLNDAIKDSELFLKDGETAANAFCNEIYADADALKELYGEDYFSNSFDITIYQTQIDSFLKKTETLRGALEKLNSGSLSGSGLIDLEQEFPELADKGEGLRNAIGKLAQEELAELLDTLGESAPKDLVESLEEIAENISDISGKSGLRKAVSILDSMKPKWDSMSKAYEEFRKEGRLSAGTVQEMHDAFQGMKGIDTGMLEGLASEDARKVQETFNLIATASLNASGCLEGLTDETREYVMAELEANGLAETARYLLSGLAAAKAYASIVTGELTSNALSEIMALVSEGGTAEVTAQQLASYALEKVNANGIALNTAADIQNLLDLALAADATSGQVIQLSRLIRAYNGEIDSTTARGAQEEKFAEKTYWKLKNGGILDSSYDNTDKGNYTGGNNTPGSAQNNGRQNATGADGQNPASEAAQSVETFNFIETALSRLEDALSRLKETAAETFRSFKERGSSYGKAIRKNTEEINAQQEAYAKYMEKAYGYGLNEEWASQVRNGSISITDIADEGLKNQINGYKEWYEKAYACQQKIQDLKKEQKELTREKIEILVTKYDKLLSKLDTAETRIQNRIGYKEAWGGSGSKTDYRDLIKNGKAQISNYIKQNNKLKELQKTAARNSEAWYEYKEQIDSNNASIQELTKSMAENAIASASLAAASAEKKNSKRDTEDEKTDVSIELARTASRKNSLANKKAKNIDARQENLQSAYATAAKGRSDYGNQIQAASKKNVSKKNKKLFEEAIKNVKGKKLVSTGTINKIVTAMKSAKGKEYSALATLLSYCTYYNANKNAEEENALNYELYALTAQQEKNALRQEQLQNHLDVNQAKADRGATVISETAAARNHEANAQAWLAKKNASAHKTAWKRTSSDRKDAGKRADFSKGKEYKSLDNKKSGDKKLKGRLQKALNAIKDKKKINKDDLSTVKKYCEKYLNSDYTYYYNCLAYNEAVENELSAEDAKVLAQAEEYAASLQAKLEKVENTVSGRDEQSELYAATAKNQTTAAKKNSYIDRQVSNIDKNVKTYKNNYSSLSSEYKAAKKAVGNTKSKDKSKQKIINDIKSKYTSKDKLIPASYIDKAFTVSGSFGLACKKYNEALEARDASKAAYDLYVQEAKEEKAALALEKMSNIETEYSNKQGVYSQKAQKINNAMDIAQAKGYAASTKYYDRLIQEESNTNKSLVDEKKKLMDSLSKSLANGSIKKYSDEWYEACAKIDDVTNAVDESTKSLIEFQNQIRQIQWDNFNYLQERIRNVTSEISFSIDELSRESLASDDTGSLTERGKAVAYLHASSYRIYQRQAGEYRKEIEKINKDIASDPYDKTLLERREALTKSYQEAAKAAQDEKYAIIDLYRQGYDALSARVQTLISDYEKLLDAQKDAYDYRNTISDKTKEISQIQKQLDAYAGDVSEETRATIQGLKASLEEAEKDLAKTQYDKYISDTKEMLSGLQEDMDQAIQDVIDAMSEEFDKLLSGIDEASQEAQTTITDMMSGIGYTPTDEFQSLLDGTGVSANVTSMLVEMKDYHAKMIAYADSIANSLPNNAAAENVTLRKVISGDTMFTDEQSASLRQMSKNPVLTEMNQYLSGAIPHTPSVQNTSRDMSIGDVNISLGGLTLPNVRNYDEFRDGLIRDKTFEKAIGGAILGSLGRSNSLEKYKYLSR